MRTLSQPSIAAVIPRKRSVSTFTLNLYVCSDCGNGLRQLLFFALASPHPPRLARSLVRPSAPEKRQETTDGDGEEEMGNEKMRTISASILILLWLAAG